MKKSILIILVLFSIVEIGCKKNEQDNSFKDVARIGLSHTPTYISRANASWRDSIYYSFGTLEESVKESQVYVYANLMGYISDSDREFVVHVDMEKTTALPDEYTMPDKFILKAGTTSLAIPITVRRKERLSVTEAKLFLSIRSNTNFERSPFGDFRVIWTNKLVQPLIWGSYARIWGLYSEDKYRFMLNFVPNRDFSVFLGNEDYVVYVSSVARQELAKYNADPTNRPLVNNGLPIAICPNCN